MHAALHPLFCRIKESISTLSHEGAALHEPYLHGNEWAYVKDCIDTGWVSSVGEYVGRFERHLRDFVGTQAAVATVNGTAALHICLLLGGVESDDEVLTPALTFVGTTNAIHYCGAIPHFVESEPASLGIDVAALQDYLKQMTQVKNKQCFNRVTGRRIKAVCVVHVLGHPADLDALASLCEEYYLTLIEDAAESLGSYYKGRHTGHHGKLAAFSFNGNKIVTTGGGGAIVTNDIELGKKAKHLTTTAKLSHAWLFAHDQVGYNYRMPNLNAALGCAQLEKIQLFLNAKRLLAEHYQDMLGGCDGLKMVTEPHYAKSNYWLNAFYLDAALAGLSDTLLNACHAVGLLLRPIWQLQPQLPMYQHCPKMPMPVAEEAAARLIQLPSSVSLGLALLNRQTNNSRKADNQCNA